MINGELEPAMLLESIIVWLASLLQVLLLHLARRNPQPVRRCTAPCGLVDSLPAELLIHVLASGELSAHDLVNVAASCSAIAAAALNEVNDELLWAPLCRARWSEKALDPRTVYPRTMARMRTHRAAYFWAERDGRRRMATKADLCNVVEWEVKFVNVPPYRIGPFPYRLNGMYVSPSFDNFARPYMVHQRGGQTVVSVEGIPDVRMVRRDDWGWELRNMMWVAQAVQFSEAPATKAGVAEIEALLRRAASTPH